ncbi:DUF5677 domain-containing protein [Verminephrobacter aporrectodeae]|uniref:DUF5677 domain-containing protein n=1 Tax=Verminephrobacter aporrectodeae TaxID=1110389 RepID=UPI0022384689|nr:DUF5677 domain-containing protein [Verminephrobacter aporrectodeae]
MTLKQTNASEWVALASDVHKALQAAADDAKKSAKGESWSTEDVAIRLLLRSCDNLQGVIVLIQSGLMAEGRTITRCLIENVFGIEALWKDSKKYIEMLKSDYERSHKNRIDFIGRIFNSVSDVPRSLDSLEKLKEIEDSINKEEKSNIINIKMLSKEGSADLFYLGYQMLSNDAAHATMQSLERYVEKKSETDEMFFCYRSQENSDVDRIDTLHGAMTAALFVGYGFSNLLNSEETKKNLNCLNQRFTALKQKQ